MKRNPIAVLTTAAALTVANPVSAGLALSDSTHYLSFKPSAGGGVSIANEATIANPPAITYATSSGFVLNHTSDGAGPGLCPTRGAAAEANLGSLHVGAHAVVKLADTSPSHAAGSFTAELVMRLTRPITWAYLFRGDNWSVSVEKYGCLVLRFVPQGSTTEVALRPSPSLADGKWHHVAVLQDLTAGTVSLYVDYQKVDYAAAQLQATSSAFFLGAYQDYSSNINNSLYDVDYDEFRLTPRALAVTDFIAPSNYDQDISPFVRADTILYSDFGERDFALGNEVTRVRETTAIVSQWGATSCVYAKPSDDLAVMSPEAYATAPVVSNDSCCACSAASGDKITAHLRAYFGDHPLTESSFTFEVFVQINSCKSSSYLLAYGGALWWFLNADGIFTMQYGESKWTEYARTPVVTDGKWHHFAVTWDADNHVLAGYCDHKLIGSKTVAAPFGKVSDPLYLGYATWESVNVGFLDVKFDALRATRGVLKPQEFLHTRRQPFDKDALLYLDFENDSTDAVYPLGMTSFWRSNATFAQVNGESVPASTLFADATSGLSTANERALIQTNSLDATNTGGGFVISNAVPSLLSADFTAETYFRLGTNNPKTSNLFLHLRTGGEVWRVRYDGSTHAFSLLTCSGGKQSSASLATYPNANDDLWHHVAVVYRHSRHTMSLYVDHALVGTVSNVDDMSAISADELQIGGYSYWKYGTYNPFMNVRWDAIRITRRALRPTEFLTTQGVTETSTPLSASFDGTWQASEEGRYVITATPFGEATLLRAARVSGEMLDATGAKVRDNTMGVKAEGGGVAIVGNGIADLGCATTEFFFRSASAQNTGALVTYAAGTDASQVFWKLDVTGTLTVCTDKGEQSFSCASPAHLLDGLWHSVTIRHETTDQGLRVEVFLDQELIVQGSVEGSFVFDEPGGYILGNASFYGRLDEFRCSNGLLDVERWLRAGAKPGLTLLLR